MHGNGFWGRGGCFGYGGFNYWHIMIMVGIVLLIVALILWVKKKNTGSHQDEALTILKNKFALGEITSEEYMARKEVIERE